MLIAHSFIELKHANLAFGNSVSVCQSLVVAEGVWLHKLHDVTWLHLVFNLDSWFLNKNSKIERMQLCGF